jgi:hypothetical protein
MEFANGIEIRSSTAANAMAPALAGKQPYGGTWLNCANAAFAAVRLCGRSGRRRSGDPI